MASKAHAEPNHNPRAYTTAMQVGAIELDDEAIRTFCEKWGVAELAVFGSVLRHDFRPDSDVDFLVTWLPGRMPRTFRMFDMKDELAELVGRSVDLLHRQSVELDYNEFRRAAILDGAKPIYAAA